MRLGQIAMSVTDLRCTHAWYRDVLGFTPARGTNLFSVGPLPSWIQGVRRGGSTCWWLVDGQDEFQLEFFQFRHAQVRPLPTDWRACDIGYTMFSVHVPDLDETLARAAAAGTPQLNAPVGDRGERRACVRDPQGVLVELMEDDPRATRPRRRRAGATGPVVRAVTLSVPDLDRSRRIFGEILGLEPADEVRLHAPEHEALWNLAGARRRAALYWANDILIELVQYLDPVGRPWPDGYQISDQGLLNIAFTFDSRAALRDALDRCREAGLRPNSPLVTLPALGSVVYVNDSDAFSIELLTAKPSARGFLGFEPGPTPRFAPFLRATRP